MTDTLWNVAELSSSPESPLTPNSLTLHIPSKLRLLEIMLCLLEIKLRDSRREPIDTVPDTAVRYLQLYRRVGVA